MSDDKKERLTRDSAPNSGKTAAQLYEQCLAHERTAAKLDLDKLKLIFATHFFFDQPLFEPPPVVDPESVINQQADLKIRTQLWQASKYRDILSLFRSWTRLEDRLFLLAWWLRQERVCQPEDILGIEVLRKLAKKKFGKLSGTDFEHADRVRAWLPYFERLVTDFRHKTFAQLMKLGYDEMAAQAAFEKRSAVEAACEWLACRQNSRNVDAPTLRNAYSRIYGIKRRRSREPRPPVR